MAITLDLLPLEKAIQRLNEGWIRYIAEEVVKDIPGFLSEAVFFARAIGKAHNMSGTPDIDIQPHHWGMVAAILSRLLPHDEVWVFGSRAKKNAKSYSDLDLVIIREQPLDLGESASLAEAFSESDLPFKVDVVDWAKTSESFRKVIERDKVVVQRPASESNPWIPERG